MSQAMQVQLSDTKDWLNKETKAAIEPLKSKASDLLKEIKFRIDDTLQSGQKIIENSEVEMNKNNQKTYRFARNANKFARTLNDTVKSVVIPEDLNNERLQALCDDLEKMCNSLGQQRAEAYRYISPYFIFDRRRLDVSLKRLFDIAKDLRNFHTSKYSKAKAVEDAQLIVDRLFRTIEETRRNQEERKQVDEKHQIVEKGIDETERVISQIRGKAELDELTKLDQKIVNLRESVKHNLRYLQKPFFKLQSLARDSEVVVTPDEISKLNDYLSDPYMALATENDGYPTLRSVLGKLDSTITRGKMKLKSTRLRKAQDQVNEILGKNSLSELQKDCKEALLQRNKASASETVNAMQKRLIELRHKLNELSKEDEFTTSKSKALHEEQNKLQERTNYLKKELEKTVQQLTNKTVQIVLPIQAVAA